METQLACSFEDLYKGSKRKMKISRIWLDDSGHRLRGVARIFGDRRRVVCRRVVEGYVVVGVRSSCRVVCRIWVARYFRNSLMCSVYDIGQSSRSSRSRRIPNRIQEASLMTILKGANTFLPQVVLASTVLALVYPPSFTWFTNRYYSPSLGFLMFAVGVNSSEKDFLEAFSQPKAILAGYIGQFVLKPILGYLFGTVSLTIFGLPTSLAAGIMLTSCVSGAQLSNYATFLTDPKMAPLSIVMTSLSTATAVFVTPSLSLLLIGKKLPVDVKGMVSNILQIVVTPIATGLLLNRYLVTSVGIVAKGQKISLIPKKKFFPKICNAIRPFLPPLSVFVTALCVGAPLAINVGSVMSPSGISVLLIGI
ncbi:putative sodium/metabolite cotransporter bass5, chloroplastic [Castilleja foliolosa]|uniref:Sodium/metabolite cotransporter bass5, chloroplastic n=1 Tax=Castilleja foliolosa TaxID=1961234 RepID=A0ABD3BGN6_9LAMI